jgi:magnesium transporter
MLLDLKFSIGTLGIGSGTFIAGLYGMNLKNFIEESDWAFFGVSGWAFVFSGVICVYGLHKLRRTQRLTMWGESGATGKKGWASPAQQKAAKGKVSLSQTLVHDPTSFPSHRSSHPAWPPLKTLPKRQ